MRRRSTSARSLATGGKQSSPSASAGGNAADIEIQSFASADKRILAALEVEPKTQLRTVSVGFPVRWPIVLASAAVLI